MSGKTSWQKAADFLTAIRALLGIVLIVFALYRPWEFFPELVVWGLLLGWTTDVLDGYLARRSGTPGTTWWGQRDLLADLMLVTALAVVLLKFEVVPTLPVLILSASAFLTYFLTQQLAVLQLFMGVIYGLFIINVFQTRPALGRWILNWVLAMAILDWPRTRENVGGFFKGVTTILKNFGGNSS